MAKNQKKAAPAPKAKKAQATKLSKDERASALSKVESKQKLQSLRKLGVINRRQQRLLAHIDGHGTTKGVPLVLTFEVQKKDGKKIPVEKLQQWNRN